MNSVQCPHCEAYTPNEPVVLLRTDQNTNQILESPSGVLIVQCRACGREFVSARGAQRALWPLTRPAAPDGVPEKVKEAYEDARLAHAAGAKIGALMAGRTALTRFLRDKGATKLKQLVEQQIITPALYGGADHLRLWAGIAGHDDIEVDTFSDQEVEDILDYFATVLEAVYTHQDRVDRYVRRTRELKDQPDAAATQHPNNQF